MPLQIMRSSQVKQQDVVANARTALENQIETHAKQIIELKGRINGLALTARLPPEILSEIFTIVATDLYHSRRWGHYGLAHAYKWISLTHVCRAWREIALNTPRLWSRIVLTRPEVVKEVFARSKKSPLWLSATISFAEDPRARVLDTLMRESNRVKELYLTAPAHTAQLLTSGWTTSADVLETLHISSDYKQFDSISFLPTPPISPQLFSGQTPKLRHLQIHRLGIDWTSPLFCPTLKTLVVHATYDTAPGVNVLPQLLEALEAMPLLETLQLNEAIPRFTDNVSKLPRDVLRTVSLPNLRSIELFSDAIDAANFLRHISQPPDARVTVNGRTERGVDDLVRVFGECLNRSTPFPTARLAPMYSSQVYVKLWRSYVDSNADALIPVEDAELSIDAYPHSRAMQALVQHATFFAHLYRFEAHIESHRHWNWDAIFERMPEVRVLSVTGHPEISFLPALAVVHDVEGEDHRHLPLRHLHTLELDGARFGCAHSDHESHFLEELVDWLIMRSNFGVPVLKLVLTACINADAEDVDRLREIVPTVEWDERECFEEADFSGTGSADDYDYEMDDLPWDPLEMAELGDVYDDADYDLDFFMIPFGF